VIRRLDHADDRLADRFAKEVSEGVKRSKRRREQLALACLRREFDTMIPLVRRVMRQTGHPQGQGRQAQRVR
jgi:hypothetical protein